MVRFSVCIPNYNYARYIAETIQSVLSQSHNELEILVSDNNSTDDSVKVISECDDPRIKTRVNSQNVGFSANLDRAASMAEGDVMIMLSSDDLVRPGALQAYASLYEQAGDDAARLVVCSRLDLIDADGELTGQTKRDDALFRDGDLLPSLKGPGGAAVYRVSGDELLRRSIQRMANPLPFCTTAYPRRIYDQVCGYGGSRQINPDKWFHWRLLAAGSVVYFVDQALFAYRWHPHNQTAGELGKGTLKFVADEYLTSHSVGEELLGCTGLAPTDLQTAFVEHDIARHGLRTLGEGSRERASRIRHFGLAAYPELCRRNTKFWALSALLALGPLGRKAARWALRRYDAKD